MLNYRVKTGTSYDNIFGVDTDPSDGKLLHKNFKKLSDSNALDKLIKQLLESKFG